MIFILTLIVIIAAVLWYREAQKEKASLQPESAKKEQKKPKPAPKPSNVIWNDNSRLLSFEPDGLSLRYKGKTYRFGCDSHEPMAIILKSGEAVAYIHNAFDVEYECTQFCKNPDYRCSTITGRKHGAEHFCLLRIHKGARCFPLRKSQKEERAQRKAYPYQTTSTYLSINKQIYYHEPNAPR